MEKQKVRFCWDCGNELWGNHNIEIYVFGHPRILHKECGHKLRPINIVVNGRNIFINSDERSGIDYDELCIIAGYGVNSNPTVVCSPPDGYGEAFTMWRMRVAPLIKGTIFNVVNTSNG